MKKLMALSLVGLAAAGCTYQDAPDPMAAGVAADPIGSDSRQPLSQVLEGRRAGPPQACVSLRDLGGNESFGEDMILFRGRTSGSTIYVNRPPAGCPTLRPGLALVVRTPSSQLCRGEIVRVVDPVPGIDVGSCGLGDFIPFSR